MRTFAVLGERVVQCVLLVVATVSLAADYLLVPHGEDDEDGREEKAEIQRVDGLVHRRAELNDNSLQEPVQKRARKDPVVPWEANQSPTRPRRQER